VTLQTREELRQTRKALPLDGWIEAWVAVDDTERPKPSPEPLLLALQKLELKPAQAVIVGDSVKDIKAGRAAGVWTGAALWGSVEVEALIDLKPDYIFRQPHELRSLWDHKTEP
jgi:pyrophosphatase PpaX